MVFPGISVSWLYIVPELIQIFLAMSYKVSHLTNTTKTKQKQKN